MANPVAGVPLSSDFNEALSIIPAQNRLTGRDPNARGVHSSWPFMTPKHARWLKNRHHEYEDTMARMFIQVPAADYEKFLASLDDPETALIAKYLTGDSVKQGGVGYIDFFLSSVKQRFVEKVQITEVLSDNYVAFFFGQQAPTFSFQGYLMNTYEDDWTMRMYRIFRDLGRGTQLAKRGQIMNIRYDSMIVSGAMLDLDWDLIAGRETYTDFSFNFLIKSVYIVYGGLAAPTKVKDKFTPAGFHLEDSSFGTSSSAAQTYIGSPPTKPEGVGPQSIPEAEAEDWDVDPTGKKYIYGPKQVDDDYLSYGQTVQPALPTPPTPPPSVWMARPGRGR
jgi:hypothetical protein